MADIPETETFDLCELSRVDDHSVRRQDFVEAVEIKIGMWRIVKGCDDMSLVHSIKVGHEAESAHSIQEDSVVGGVTLRAGSNPTFLVQFLQGLREGEKPIG